MLSNLRNLFHRHMEKFSKLFRMLYIEPVIFTLVFAHSLSGTVMRNEVMYQACTAVFHYNVSDCAELSNNNDNAHMKEIETALQPYVANLFMMKTLLESIVPAVCGVFVGAWSDHYGRKPLLVLSMIGFSCTYVIAVIVCELAKSYEVNPWYYILSAVPHSLLGGNCVFGVAAFCFITDVTNREDRPYRMIFMEAFVFVGLMGGSLLSSYLYAATNASFTFAVSAVCLCVVTIYVITCVPETLNYKRPNEKDEVITEKPNDLKDPNTEELRRSTNLFSWTLIRDMWQTCVKPRPHRDRSIVWLITGTMFISIFVIDGTMTVFYLFVREKFQWSVRDFSYFDTFSHVMPMVGTVLGFVILRKVFQMSVVSLALLAMFSEIFSCIAKGLASEPWHLYLSTVLGIFKAMATPMCHTVISNIVPPTDMGKIFSIKNIFHSFAPFVAAPLYTLIYKQTITTFPGLFNLISAALYVIAVVLVIIVLRFKHSHPTRYGEILK